jgi:hypothetical protein
MWGGGLPNPYVRAPARTPREVVERLREFAQAGGRDPASIGIEGRFSLGRGTPDDWRKQAAEWRALGATHLSVVTMRGGLVSPAAHVDAIRRFYDATKDA